MGINPIGFIRYPARIALCDSGWVPIAKPLARAFFGSNGSASATRMGRMAAVRHHASLPSAHFHLSLLPAALVVSVRQPQLASAPGETRDLIDYPSDFLGL